MIHLPRGHAAAKFMETTRLFARDVMPAFRGARIAGAAADPGGQDGSQEYAAQDGVGLAALVRGGDVTVAEVEDAARRAIADVEPTPSTRRSGTALRARSTPARRPLRRRPVALKDVAPHLEGQIVQAGAARATASRSPRTRTSGGGSAPPASESSRRTRARVRLQRDDRADRPRADGNPLGSRAQRRRVERRGRASSPPARCRSQHAAKRRRPVSPRRSAGSWLKATPRAPIGPGRGRRCSASRTTSYSCRTVRAPPPRSMPFTGRRRDDLVRRRVEGPRRERGPAEPWDRVAGDQGPGRGRARRARAVATARGGRGRDAKEVVLPLPIPTRSSGPRPAGQADLEDPSSLRRGVDAPPDLFCKDSELEAWRLAFALREPAGGDPHGYALPSARNRGVHPRSELDILARVPRPW